MLMTNSTHNSSGKQGRGLLNGTRIFLRRITDASGATSIEYALMIALIAITAIVAITLLGESLQTTYKKTGDALAQLDSPDGSDGSGGGGSGSGSGSGGDSGGSGGYAGGGSDGGSGSGGGSGNSADGGSGSAGATSGGNSASGYLAAYKADENIDNAGRITPGNSAYQHRSNTREYTGSTAYGTSGGGASSSTNSSAVKKSGREGDFPWMWVLLQVIAVGMLFIYFIGKIDRAGESTI
jgi:Flp pilus assembly pilin Flp